MSAKGPSRYLSNISSTKCLTPKLPNLFAVSALSGTWSLFLGTTSSHLKIISWSTATCEMSCFPTSSCATLSPTINKSTRTLTNKSHRQTLSRTMKIIYSSKVEFTSNIDKKGPISTRSCSSWITCLPYRRSKLHPRVGLPCLTVSTTKWRSYLNLLRAGCGLRRTYTMSIWILIRLWSS